MSCERSDGTGTFLQMAGEFPVRTGIFTVSLPAFAILQVVNGFVHGGSLPLIGVFAALLVAFSTHVTRYHLVVYRQERLDRWLIDDR